MGAERRSKDKACSELRFTLVHLSSAGQMTMAVFRTKEITFKYASIQRVWQILT